jgi:sulfite exporter TauE/SafE
MRGAPRPAGAPGPSTWLLFAAYHGARLGAYAAAGVLAGSLGHGIAMLGLGRALSAGAGIVLVVSAAVSLRPVRQRVVSTGVARLLGRVAAAAHRQGDGHPIRRAAIGGLVNAALPCGMLYGALAAAAALGHAGESALFMTLFGLGTLPAVAACWAMTGALAPLLRGRLRVALPWTLAAVGVLLIARGLAAPPVDAGGVHSGHAAHGAMAHPMPVTPR